MKFLKILIITNISIILLIGILRTIAYICNSFINWELNNYIEYLIWFENNKEFRSFYVFTLFISFIFTFIWMIMNENEPDDYKDLDY